MRRQSFQRMLWQGGSITFLSVALFVSALLSLLACTEDSRNPLAQYDHGTTALDNAGLPSLQSHATLVAYYDSYHGEVFQICLANYLTGENILLPNLYGFEPENAGLSANGRYVVYDTYEIYDYDFNRRDIRLYDRHTTTMISLPGLNKTWYRDIDPSVSSTGRFIAFTSNRSGNYNILLYDRSTAKLVGLSGLNSSGSDVEPSISNDARYIAFASNRSGAWKIYLYDRAVARLVGTPGLQDNPGWDRYTPDLDGSARYIVFGQNRLSLPNPNIALYDRVIKTFASIPGLNSSVEEYGPSLSHDARYIAFERNLDEPGDHHPAIQIYDRTTFTLLPVRFDCGADQRGPSLQDRRPTNIGDQSSQQ